MENVQSENNIEENQAALNMDQKCRVCHKAYCEPKLLPCGHLMCRKCLLSWLKQTRRATCPYCRYPILKGAEDSQSAPTASECKEDVPTEGDQHCTEVDDTELQKLLDGFPTELWTAALVKAERLLREKHECQACGEEATSYCHQCGDTLCGSCKNVHSRLTATRLHIVEELSSLTAERLADFQPPTSCPEHPEQTLGMFCPQHNTSMCQECLLSSHQDCSKGTSFAKQVEQAKMKLMQLMKVMTDSSASLDGALRELDQHLADMEQREKTALADIQTLKERLCKAVEDRCQRLKLQVNKALANIREAVKEAKAFLLGRQSRLGSHTALAQRVHNSTVRDVVCGMASVMEARVIELDRQVKLPETAKVITTVTTVLDEKAVVAIEKQVAMLGEVKIDAAPVTVNVAACDVFDQNHGKCIALSNDGKTATHTGANEGYGTAVVRKPLAVGDLVEFQIDLSCKRWSGVNAFLGVTTQSPGTASLKDVQCACSMDCTAVISCYAIYISGKKQSKRRIRIPLNIKEGSILGVHLDQNYNLHLYVDGNDQGIFAQNLAQPCYALYDATGYVSQVTLLQRRHVSV